MRGVAHLSWGTACLGALALLAVPVLSPARSAGAEDRPAQTEVKISGEIRNYGFALGGVLKKWEEAFQRRHPGVTFKDTLPTSDAAFPALVTYQSDLGPNGGEPAIVEALSFYETRGYHASFVVVASGAFDTEGRSNGPVVFVQQDNPLSEISIEQLDGVFGSARNGGLEGFVWSPAGARGAEKDIRTWGQLGLEGKYAKAPIQTYGHGPSGTTRFFQLHVLANTDKWNPNYRGYVESGSKQIAAIDKPAQTLGAKHMLGTELASNPFGIGWSTMSQAKGIPGIKLLAVAPRGGGKAVVPTQASFQDRSYPLVRNIYIYFDRKPDTPLDPKLKAFLSFALSDDGQRMVAEGNYLPLPAAMRREQLAKLD